MTPIHAEQPRGAVRIGCCGFPVSRQRYYEAFRVVEVDSSFYQPPRQATAERWRREAPTGFQFTVKAWQLVTHPPTSPTYRKLGADRPERLDRCGHFKRSPEVRLAWERTRRLARTLRAQIVLFQTPMSLRPDADKLRDLYAFFETVERGEFLLAWEPRGPAWTEKLVARVLADLDLVHAADPLALQYPGRPGPPASTAPPAAHTFPEGAGDARPPASTAPPAAHTFPEGAGDARPPASTAPLAVAPSGRMGYFRLHGTYREGRRVYRHRYSDEELKILARLCRFRPTFVFFNNSEMFDDARRFAETVA
ncbi:MAG: DUF72 domain-containing protein [Elusimicrobia bacterium]|nr:DUF72 domain-containing protein [Elusimicrobiota bacterium]